MNTYAKTLVFVIASTVLWLLATLILLLMVVAPAQASQDVPPEELARRAGAPPRDYERERQLSVRAVDLTLTLADWDYVAARMPYVSPNSDFERCHLWYFGAPDGIIATISMALVYQPGLVDEARKKAYMNYLVQRAGQNIPYVPHWTQPLSSFSARQLLDSLASHGITP